MYCILKKYAFYYRFINIKYSFTILLYKVATQLFKDFDLSTFSITKVTFIKYLIRLYSQIVVSYSLLWALLLINYYSLYPYIPFPTFLLICKLTNLLVYPPLIYFYVFQDWDKNIYFNCSSAVVGSRYSLYFICSSPGFGSRYSFYTPVLALDSVIVYMLVLDPDSRYNLYSPLLALEPGIVYMIQCWILMLL